MALNADLGESKVDPGAPGSDFSRSFMPVKIAEKSKSR